MERIDIRLEKHQIYYVQQNLNVFSQYLLALNKTWHLLPNNNNNIFRCAYFLIFPTIVEFRTPMHCSFYVVVLFFSHSFILFQGSFINHMDMAGRPYLVKWSMEGEVKNVQKSIHMVYGRSLKRITGGYYFYYKKLDVEGD